MQQADFDTATPDKAHEAYKRIRAALNLYRSPPGAFLNIRTVAQRLRVSATPVREALIRLAHEEVIGFIRGRGYYTKTLDAGDIIADYALASIMLKSSIEMTTGHFTLSSGVFQDLWQGQPVIDELQALAISLRVEALYESVAHISANRRLICGIESFCARTGQMRQFGLLSSPAIHEALWSLHTLSEAMLAGKRSLAAKIVRKHTRLIIDAVPELAMELNQKAQLSKLRLEDLL